MLKDFDGWTEIKRNIHQKEKNKLYHERQIWWCALGVNVGSEQDGTGKDNQRPVLVIKAMSRTTCYIVPLSTSTKQHRLRVPIGLVEGKQATALMSQLRLVDTKRFIDKVGTLDQNTFETIRKAAKAML